MSPDAAPGALRIAVDNEIQRVNQKVIAKTSKAETAMLNARWKVLSGNKSPSPPGSPPGRRSGHLRLAWTKGNEVSGSRGKGICINVWIKSGSYYAEYLEDGTRKMAARPFVEKIKVVAAPKIVAVYSSI